MLANQTKDLLQQLRRGQMNDADAAAFDGVPAGELLAELRQFYPVVFLERTIGRKHEIGMAKSVGYEFGIGKVENSPFPFVFMFTAFRECVLLNSYGNKISGVTMASSINARLAGGENKDLVLTMNRCFKLDKTPDEWRVKKMRQRPMRLSESLLKLRGWNFDVLFPGGTEPFQIMEEGDPYDYREAIGCAPAVPGSISAEEAVRRIRDA